MSWTEVFPVFSDEMLEDYERGASISDMDLMEGYYGVERVMNPSRESVHVVSISLYWGNLAIGDPPQAGPVRRF